jgi:hypothetical protein
MLQKLMLKFFKFDFGTSWAGAKATAAQYFWRAGTNLPMLKRLLPSSRASTERARLFPLVTCLYRHSQLEFNISNCVQFNGGTKMACIIFKLKLLCRGKNIDTVEL